MQIDTKTTPSQSAKPLFLTSDNQTLSTESPMFNFGAVLRILRRRKWIILFVAVICVVLTWALLNLTTDKYQSRASLLLEEAVLEPFGGEQLFAETSLNNVYVESQMLVIRSPLLATQVVDTLELDEIESFMNPPRTRLRAWVDRQIELVQSVLGGAPEPEPDLSDEDRLRVAVETLRQNLTVTRAGLTLVLNIGYTSPDPELSALIANAVADAYIESRRDFRRQSAAQASDWFEERILELRAKALSTESSISRFRLGGEPDGSRTGMDLSAQDQLRTAISERLEKQTIHDRLTAVLASDRPLALLPPRLANDRLRELGDRRDALVSERADAADPDAVDKAIAALEREIRAELTRYVAAVKEELDAAVAAESEARDLVTEGRGVVPGVRGAEFELRNLEAEARIYRQLYESYFGSYLRMAQQESFPTNDASLIAAALVPKFPLGPGKSRLLLLAAVFGITLGIGGAFLGETADDRLRSRSQLASVLGAPTLGLLPIGEGKPKGVRGGKPPKTATAIRPPEKDLPVVVIADRVLPSHRLTKALSRTINEPFSAYTDTIRRVKAEVDKKARMYDVSGATVIGFVSDESSENSSVAATNFAELLAVGGNRTLLIDLNWFQPFLTEVLTPNASSGVVDLAKPNVTHDLEDIVWLDQRSGMHLLPNRALDPATAVDPSVFDSDVQRQWLQPLRASYDYIVVDFSALADSMDAVALADQIFGFVFVSNWGVTSKKRLVSTIANSGLPRSKIIGGVICTSSTKASARYDDLS